MHQKVTTSVVRGGALHRKKRKKFQGLGYRVEGICSFLEGAWMMERGREFQSRKVIAINYIANSLFDLTVKR